MTPASHDARELLRREVQELLGLCLLRLQHYEKLIKNILVNYEISGPAHDLETVRATRTSAIARDTLGTLVEELLGS
jgi:hypothetical protein